MSENDILEMDSVCDTDEFEGDTELGMIDEEVGENHFVFRKRFGVWVLVWILFQLCLW